MSSTDIFGETVSSVSHGLDKSGLKGQLTTCVSSSRRYSKYSVKSSECKNSIAVNTQCKEGWRPHEAKMLAH